MLDRSRVDASFEMAKKVAERVFAREQKLSPFAMVLAMEGPDGTKLAAPDEMLIPCPPSDAATPQGLTMFAAIVRGMAKKCRAVAALTAAQMWLANVPSAGKEPTPEERRAFLKQHGSIERAPGAFKCIVITVEAVDGTERVAMARVTKGEDGKLKLGEWDQSITTGLTGGTFAGLLTPEVRA